MGPPGPGYNPAMQTPGSHAVLAPALLLVLAAGSALLAQPLAVTPQFVTAPGEHITGIAFQNGLLYAVTKPGNLRVVDPATGQVLQTVNSLLPTSPVHIHGICASPSSNSFWIYDMVSTGLYEISSTTWAVQSVVYPPGPMPYGMTAKGGVLWVGHHTNAPATPLHAIDPATGNALASWMPGLYDVHGLAWVGGHLWALDNFTNQLKQFDRNGDLRGVGSLPPSSGWTAMAHDGDRFWVVDIDNFGTLDFPPFTQDPLIAGQQVEFRVSTISPGNMVWVVASLAGPGLGLCIPGNDCLDVLAPLHLLGQSWVNPAGMASFTLDWPNVAPGIPVWTQTLVLDFAGGSSALSWTKSNVVLSVTR